MNLQEAFSIFEMSPGASPAEIKKKYKELSKKYHPDVNKEDGAEDKFKSINEAHQCIISGKGNDRVMQPSDASNPFQNPFGRTVSRPMEHISLNATISFKESVLGCQRELKFNRNGKCDNCNGEGLIHINNGCDKCGGKGQIVGRQGNMIFSRTCDKCMGRQQSEHCHTCSNTGIISTQVSINITIPGGVTNNNILRLNGMGNYMGSFMGMDQYTEAHLHLTITPEDGLSLEDADVISTLNISLLEAIKGIEKNVKTILGDKVISIPPLSKNKEEIKIPKLGVSGHGAHRVILNVQYPDNIDELVNVLSNQQEA